MNTQEIFKILLMISPLVLIQLVLAVYALVDLARRTQVHGPRWAWALALIVTIVGFPTGIIVSGIYLAWGRQAEV
jgi:hypothetical protein